MLEQYGENGDSTSKECKITVIQMQYCHSHLNGITRV